MQQRYYDPVAGRLIREIAMSNLLVRALVSAQRALLGAISCNMRAISLELLEQTIVLTVYHDGTMEEDEIEDFDADVVTSVVADFPGFDASDPEIKYRFIRLDAPAKIEYKGQLVFQRKESFKVTK